MIPMSLRQISSIRAKSAKSAPKLLQTLAACRPIRSYHSYDHYDEPVYDPSQERILEQALSRVPELGFKHMALVQGARDVGYGDGIQSLFTNGTYDLVLYHLTKQRLRLFTLVDSGTVGSVLGAEVDDYAMKFREEFAKLPTESSKLEKLLVERLMGNKPYISKLHEALGVMLSPPHLVASLEQLGDLADDIAFLAGDNSTSFDWYSKRMALSSIYAYAELFMMQDQSTDYRDTAALVKSRVQELETFGGVVDQSLQWLRFSANSSINLLRSQLARG